MKCIPRDGEIVLEMSPAELRTLCLALQRDFEFNEGRAAGLSVDFEYATLRGAKVRGARIKSNRIAGEIRNRISLHRQVAHEAGDLLRIIRGSLPEDEPDEV